VLLFDDTLCITDVFLLLNAFIRSDDDVECLRLFVAFLSPFNDPSMDDDDDDEEEDEEEEDDRPIVSASEECSEVGGVRGDIFCVVTS
jgi:hypothetical protein